MSLINPLEQARRNRRQRIVAETASTSQGLIATAHARKCTTTSCKGDMVLAVSRGNRVMVCMSCRTSLPVTAEWQVTGEKPPRQAHAVEEAGAAIGAPLDIHRSLKNRTAELSAGDTTLRTDDNLDVSWLPLAAAKLNISPSIKDYVMVPVILFYANVPNRNGLGFLTKDMADWDTQTKVARYKSWRGAPMHIEHDNQDPTKAIGVVLDTHLAKHDAEPLPFWKNVAYMAVDRGKNPQIAKNILSGKVTTYSMGAYINGGYVCSVCEKAACGHIVAPTSKRKYISLIENGSATDSSGKARTLFDKRRGPENDNLPELPVLAFAAGKRPLGFEVSVVETPAYPMAEADNVQYWS